MSAQRQEWKMDWPSAFVGAIFGGVVMWVVGTSWLATALVH